MKESSNNKDKLKKRFVYVNCHGDFDFSLWDSICFFILIFIKANWRRVGIQCKHFTLLLLTKFGIVTNQFNVSFVLFVTRLHWTILLLDSYNRWPFFWVNMWMTQYM